MVDALAGAGFADDAEHLALVEREADAVDRAHHPALARETTTDRFSISSSGMNGSWLSA